MAVCRGGIAFWVGCLRSHGSRPPIKKQHCGLTQGVNWQWIEQTRPLGSASWAPVPPSGLRYQNVKLPLLSHPFHHASQPQRASRLEEDWEDSLSVCVLVRRREADGQHTLVEIPLFGQSKLGELLAPGAGRQMDFPFPLTTVDGRREDDISVGPWGTDEAGAEAAALGRGRVSFRHLFEAESCPAPFVHGSQFYCFHCPGTEPLAVHGVKCRLGAVGLENEPSKLPLSLATFLCSQVERAECSHDTKDSEGEERLAMVYERLRIELPCFFAKSHDYTMYSDNVEFLNGLINTHTRGRLSYRLALSLWRLLCLCYYSEARLEVLKLTKHAEDGTVKARWRVWGLPFYSLLLRFYRKDKSHLYRSYDAFSTFYVGQDGLIHCHKVEKVMQAQPPVLPRVTSLLAGALVALGVQDHRPALNLLPLFFSALRQGRN